MPAAAMVTLILTAVLVLALAFYLIRVVLILRHVNDQLGKITFGVRAIAHQTEPIGELVGAMNGNLTAVAGALEDLVDTAVTKSTQEAAA
ncbi:MAG: hypothetical protein ACRBK7_18960 [Acidimicrobiales bacterium]